MKRFFTEFPWFRSFIVSLLASAVFYFANNPNVLSQITVPGLIRTTAVYVVQYGSLIIAVLGFGVSAVSFYYQREQQRAHSQLKEELVRHSTSSSNESESLDDLKKSPGELAIEQAGRIADYLWISDEGDVNVIESNLSQAQKILLYLVGKRYAYELDLVDSPKVNTIELSQGARVPQQSIHAWVLPLEGVMEKHHYSDTFRLNDYWVDPEQTPLAIDYISGEKELPEPFVMADYIDQNFAGDANENS